MTDTTGSLKRVEEILCRRESSCGCAESKAFVQTLAFFSFAQHLHLHRATKSTCLLRTLLVESDRIMGHLARKIPSILQILDAVFRKKPIQPDTDSRMKVSKLTHMHEHEAFISADCVLIYNRT